MAKLISFEEDVIGIDHTLSYCICTTPRSGSNLLMFTLEEQGLGDPAEYLNRNRLDVKRYIEHHQDIDLGDMVSFSNGLCQYPLDNEAFVRHLNVLQQKRLSANGVFGTKVFATDLLHSKQRFNTLRSELSNLKVIYLYRDNIIDQAVSFYIATKNNNWFQLSNASVNEFEEIPFDFKSIFKLVRSIKKGNKFWKDVLDPNDPDVITLSYEDLCSNFQSSIQKTNQYLSHPNLMVPQQPIKKQVNPIKERFVKLFKTKLLEYRRTRG